MTESDNSCTFRCSVIAALAALVLWIILWFAFGLGWFSSFVLAVLGGILLWFVLRSFLCNGQTASSGSTSTGTTPTQPAASPAPAASGAVAPPAETAPEADKAPTAEAAPAAAPESTKTPAAETAAASPVSSATVKPSQKLPGQEELAARKGEWTYQGSGDPAPVKAAPKPRAKAAAATAPQADEARPATLYDAPPAEGADDLKLISGVGPKLEQTLNELGIYRYAQVADWGPSDIAWVDSRLPRFKGRIARDDWMSQARTLAAGGETEFSARKKKK